VGGALASIFGAKAPPTINKTMTYKSPKYYVSYFQEYFQSRYGVGEDFCDMPRLVEFAVVGNTGKALPMPVF
jgi:hypothetical protein